MGTVTFEDRAVEYQMGERCDFDGIRMEILFG
jgi:hypothetical protein